MRLLVVSLMLLMSFYKGTAQLWLVDPLEAIYPDHNSIKGYSDTWKSDVAMDAFGEVHVLVKVPVGQLLKVSASLDGKELDMGVWSQLIDVPVEQNTGLEGRTEQYLNQENPFVIREAPFRIFEIIRPMEQRMVTTTANFTAFRLTVPSNLIRDPGKYKVDLVVDNQGVLSNGTYQIEVHPTLLPKLEESNFFYTNWYSLSKMEEYHDMERWSEEWYAVLEKYARMMAHGRQNSITLPHELFYVENDKIVMEETKLLRFINVFRKYGFKYFEAPHLMNRGDNDDWGDPELKVALTKRRYYKENGKEDIKGLMEQIKAFTTKYDLSENWLQHVADEPTAVNGQCYKDVVGQIKKIYPEIIIMEATNDREQIAGAIDIWCPLIDDFQKNEAFFREREEKGERVLVYTCLVPGGKWLNRTLDMEKLRQVYFGWGAAHYNTGGYLHWGLNKYLKDPFENSSVHHMAPGAAANNFLPAGDTHIIYPGKDGPLSSLRFEAHRVGCEDYDLLMKLKDKNLKLFRKLVKNQFRSYTDYNLNLRKYRKTKRKLLKGLE